MQFINQLKTVLVLSIGFVLFPQPQSVASIVTLLVGLACVFSGVGYYTHLKSRASPKSTAPPPPAAIAAGTSSSGGGGSERA
mgnify:CR=1 FL=1